MIDERALVDEANEDTDDEEALLIADTEASSASPPRRKQCAVWCVIIFASTAIALGANHYVPAVSQIASPANATFAPERAKNHDTLVGNFLSSIPALFWPEDAANATSTAERAKNPDTLVVVGAGDILMLGAMTAAAKPKNGGPVAAHFFALCDRC